MAGEWRELTWGDLATLEYGRALRGYAERMGRFRVFGTNGPIGWHDEALCHHPTVITGRKGAYRGVHYSPGPCFVIDTAFYLEPKCDIDVRWAYYELLMQDINAMDSGSAIPSTSREDFYNLPVRIPPLSEQRAIAHILGTLDDKIELNRRMSRTLEEIARALFKSWFVDFEPVRANAEGRWKRGESLPGLPAHLYDLFPDRLVQSELGEIPEGWEVKPIRDEVEIVRGVSYRSEELSESGTALVTLKSFNRGGGYRFDGLKPYIGAYKPDQAVHPGEIIVAQTDVTQSADVVGKPALVLPGTKYRGLVASLDVLIIRPRGRRLPREFFYQLFSTSQFHEHIHGHINGTTVLHLSKDGVPSFRFGRPPGEVGRAFSALVRPPLTRLMKNAVESRTLATLRDALLPKLICGELRVTRPMS